mgnify:CR=1 FL=1
MEDTFNTENTFGMEDTYELDRLIGASPASASVLDIIAASAKEASWRPWRPWEAGGKVIIVERKLHFCNRCSSVTTSSKVALESSEEASGEASTSKAAFLEEIAATTTAAAGAEDASDDGLTITNHLGQGSLMDQGPSANFLGNNQVSQVTQDGTSSTRQNYLFFSLNKLT